MEQIVKPALCVSKHKVVENEKIKDLAEINLDQLDYHIRDRSECETNFDYLQIIPYITLRRKSDNSIFIYQRGKQSGESRLTGKCSIGLGGHIEVDVNKSPYVIIYEEASRELEEEVGIVLNDTDKKRLLFMLIKDEFNLLYINKDEVGKVHLGISIIFDIDDSIINEHEKDVIEKGEFLSVQEIKKLHFNENILLEAWSVSVLFDNKTLNN